MAPGFVVFCLPRPHEVGSDPISFDDTQQIDMISFLGRDTGGCSVVLDGDRPLGDATTQLDGFCDDGASPDGFAMTLAGSLPFTRTCVDVDEPIEATLAGTVRVDSASF